MKNMEIPTIFWGTTKFNLTLISQVSDMTLNRSSCNSECFRNGVRTAAGILANMVQNFYSNIYSDIGG